MLNENYTAKQGENSELILTRIFDAPKELVFKCFTEEEHLKKWWTPKGFKATHSKMDFKIGGIYHYCNVASDGTEVWGRMEFTEITEPDKLKYKVSFSNNKSEICKHPMAPDWPIQTETTITFEELGNKTKITLCGKPINPTEIELTTFKNGFESMKVGFAGTFDNLDLHIKTTNLGE